ncbi:SGNH/GDSL hydrolase family protein [Mucilaginibacter corticis]|uniref:SGNH/GDSL hydrolase family protein n=1 Tax=Mucilaginibacter corticis TaxID=2597670 RepID=A0A556MS69_9SPHI|nr:SGNH/GDSL hydrolase family protein [Mucilaginibacter corticis]TSJ42804.1 SGNH/GDSL hydrolase family protein [Mucilaginibacter corticis]
MSDFFSALLILSALSGCAKKVPVQSAGNKTGVVAKPDSLKYLALGDSYTIGQSVPLNQSFPYQLTAQLNATLKVGAPTIIATTGWTTNDLIKGINNSGLVSQTYDLVTLLIGVNDQFRGVDQSVYRSNFIALLNIAIRFAGGNKDKVFIISIPDYSVTPFAGYNSAGQLSQIVKEIDEFNAINKTESSNENVNYLDITDISRRAASDGSLLAPDGLHPSAKMYGLWIERLLPLVKAKLHAK